MTDLEQLIARLTDVQVYGLTIWGEARGEGAEGMLGVGNVIRNRSNEKPPLGLRGVCLQPAQFSCWRPVDGTANYFALEEAVRTVRRGERGQSASMRACLLLAAELAAGQHEDNVLKATHYMTEFLWKKGVVKWAQGKSPVCQIRNHVFFAGIRW